MKNLISYSIFSLLLLLGACRKSDNPKIPTLTRVPVPNLVQGTGDQAISSTTYAQTVAFSTSFAVTLKFPNDIPPSKMDVVVRKNGDNTKVKIWQAGITSWPTTVNVTGPKLASAFGDTIRTGDKYEFGVDIYTANGGKFEAFPLIGLPYGSGIAGEYGGTATTIVYAAICPFNPSDFSGNFTVIADDFDGLYPVGGQIPVTVVGPKQLSIILPQTGLPLIIDVNTGTLGLSVAAQNYGVLPAPDDKYGKVTVKSVTGGTNSVDACKFTIHLYMEYTVAAGSFGAYDLILQK